MSRSSIRSTRTALWLAVCVLLIARCSTSGTQPTADTNVGATPPVTEDQSHEPEVSAGPQESVADAGDPLAVLRAALERARSARPDEHLTTGPVESAVLVGMSRQDILAALGEPGQCRVAPQTICDPNVQPVRCREEMRAQPAPCTSDSDLFYSFYHLPEGWLGGGPELLLHFEGDRCVAADWRFTQ